MKTGFAAALLVSAMLALGAPGALSQGPESVAPLAAQLSPAVVNIGTSRMIGGGGLPFPEAPEGSPLRVHTEALAAELAKALGPGFAVEVGMRYGEPALADALDRLTAAGARRIVVAPLYPQHAESSRGTALRPIRCSFSP